MCKKYNFKIKSINFKTENNFVPSKINVFVGANNCGKTQLLKDILSDLTGASEKLIIINNVDFDYPDTWQELINSYNMSIVEQNGAKRLCHVAPKFDEKSYDVASYNLEQTLSYCLTEDKPSFKKHTGAGLITYLNTDNRLSLARRQNISPALDGRIEKNVLETVFNASKEHKEKISDCSKKIFGIDAYLNIYNLGSLEFRLGDDFASVPQDPKEANEIMKNYDLLDFQGDGIRSVLGIVSAIISVNKPVILLDEPEAFLHPPQAYQLGKMIPALINDNAQIFIATHSVDFLKGLLAENAETTIIHLDRIGNNTSINVLDNNVLKEIAIDPLLSSSRVLEGMFYKGVVATEADADSIFYQRCFEKIGGTDQIHFVNAHNKQTLEKIVLPYQQLGIKYAMIADIDLIRDTHEFKKFLKHVNDKDLTEKILKNRDKIISFFEEKNNKTKILTKTLSRMSSLVNEINVTESEERNDKILLNLRSELNKIRNDSDIIVDLKKRGRGALNSELSEVFDELYEDCKKTGLFLVPVGELESWLEDYDIKRTDNKKNWITKALTKLFSVEVNQEKQIWKFMNEIQQYFES